MSQGTAQLILVVLVVTGGGAWFTPAFIAGGRKHAQRWAITALLAFSLALAFFGPLGWLAMAIAWIVSIVWSLTGAPARASDRASA